jgi:hypothetical protein
VSLWAGGLPAVHQGEPKASPSPFGRPSSRDHHEWARRRLSAGRRARVQLASGNRSRNGFRLIEQMTPPAADC